MISVAASLAQMHPQTLRMYEQRRLIEPTRTPRGTRLYSQENVDQLRRIQELTNEGINLNGVRRIFDLERQLGRAARRIQSLERQIDQVRREAAAEVERVHRSVRAELVVYRPQQNALTPTAPQGKKIPINRPDGKKG